MQMTVMIETNVRLGLRYRRARASSYGSGDMRGQDARMGSRRTREFRKPWGGRLKGGSDSIRRVPQRGIP